MEVLTCPRITAYPRSSADSLQRFQVGFNTQMTSANTSRNFNVAERLALTNTYHEQCPVTLDDAIHHAHIIPQSDGALPEARRVVRRSYHSIKSPLR